MTLSTPQTAILAVVLLAFYFWKTWQHRRDTRRLIAVYEGEKALLVEQAMRDPLTNLYTRRYFDDRARAIVSDAKREKHDDVFVIYADIDHFKQINDTCGHHAGDQVLRGVATIIDTCLWRGNDLLARYGGEEFVIIGRGYGNVVAERIRQAVAAEPIFGVHVTISLGLANFNREEETDSLGSTISRADDALRVAKTHGRNQVAVSS